MHLSTFAFAVITLAITIEIVCAVVIGKLLRKPVAIDDLDQQAYQNLLLMINNSTYGKFAFPDKRTGPVTTAVFDDSTQGVYFDSKGNRFEPIDDFPTCCGQLKCEHTNSPFCALTRLDSSQFIKDAKNGKASLSQLNRERDADLYQDHSE